MLDPNDLSSYPVGVYDVPGESVTHLDTDHCSKFGMLPSHFHHNGVNGGFNYVSFLYGSSLYFIKLQVFVAEPPLFSDLVGFLFFGACCSMLDL